MPRPLLYTDLAPWFHLLTAPADYAGEAARHVALLREAHDDEASGRGLRYLEWTTDPDPTDTTYDTDFVYLLREPGRPLRAVQDHHVAGLFARAAWLAWLEDAGFEARCVSPPAGADPAAGGELFIARRPSVG